MSISRLLIIRDIKTVMGNITIAHRCYKHVSSDNRNHIKVIVLQAFVITKDKNSKQTFKIDGILVTNLTIDNSNISTITKAAQTRW